MWGQGTPQAKGMGWDQQWSCWAIVRACRSHYCLLFPTVAATNLSRHHPNFSALIHRPHVFPTLLDNSGLRKPTRVVPGTFWLCAVALCLPSRSTLCPLSCSVCCQADPRVPCPLVLAGLSQEEAPATEIRGGQRERVGYFFSHTSLPWQHSSVAIQILSCGHTVMASALNGLW